MKWENGGRHTACSKVRVVEDETGNGDFVERESPTLWEYSEPLAREKFSLELRGQAAIKQQRGAWRPKQHSTLPYESVPPVAAHKMHELVKSVEPNQFGAGWA